MASLRRARARGPRRASAVAGQQGFTIVEVMVSALIVVLVAVGVLAGLDSASVTSGATKRRATGADLAQQDQERLRALKVSDLSNLRQTSTQVVDTVPYTVTSRADWVTDSTGTTNCTTQTSSADYLRITSTVTWASMNGVQPVTEQSLVAPAPGSFGAGQGSLAVFVNDRNGQPVVGLPISISGTPAFNDPTDAHGCVIDGYTSADNHQVSFSKAGYVDPNGNGSVNVTQGVVGGATTVASLQYDLAADLELRFVTRPTVNGTDQVTTADVVALTGGPTVRQFGTAGSLRSLISTGSTLFPFTGGYSAYAGLCAAADPTKYSGESANAASVAPGATASLTVREPALNLRVTRNGAAFAGRVVVYGDAGAGCSAVKRLYTANAAGALSDPGLPYGSYYVCADDSGVNPGSPRLAFVGALANNRYNGGTPIQSLAISTSSSYQGSCP